DATEEARQNEVIDGIRSIDTTSPWSAHWDNGDARGGSLTTDETSCAGHMGSFVINGNYSFNPANPTWMHERVREAYSTNYTSIVGRAAIPVLTLDEPYETEPQGSPLEIRTKTHRAMCEGSCGISFSKTGWWMFSDWTSSSQGATEYQYAGAFWASQPWYAMAPDVSSAYVTSGRSTITSSSWVGVLASPTNLIAHYPSGAASSCVVAMSQFSKTMRARWWDPTAG